MAETLSLMPPRDSCAQIEPPDVASGGLSLNNKEGGNSTQRQSCVCDFDVDAQTNRVLDVALEMTRAALGLAHNFANGIIARQIAELARAGERKSRSFM